MIDKEMLLGVFGSALVFVFSIYYLNQYNYHQKQFYDNLKTRNVNSNAASSSNQMSLLVLSREEVTKHSNSKDCWIIIDDSVYDVSNYDVNHPGGASRIDSYCAKDATQAFSTKDGRGAHSSAAKQLLSGMLLGKLNGQTDSQKIQEVKNNNAAITPTFNDETEGEDD